jgi:hypothetical protein
VRGARPAHPRRAPPPPPPRRHLGLGHLRHDQAPSTGHLDAVLASTASIYVATRRPDAGVRRTDRGSRRRPDRAYRWSGRRPSRSPGGAAAVATASTASVGRGTLPTTVPKPGFATRAALPLITAEPDRAAARAPALREGRPYHRPRQRCPVFKGWWFTGEATGGNRKRVDALYCSPRCRTRAYRQRRSRSEDVTP